MSEGDLPDKRRSAERFGSDTGSIAAFPRKTDHRGTPAEGPVVSFDRHELRHIFDLYGRRVAEGEWRDYAISFTVTKAVFSIYRRASEVPLFRIEKDPSLTLRQGAYAVVAATGLILKRGQDLRRVLQVLEKKPKLVLV